MKSITAVLLFGTLVWCVGCDSPPATGDAEGVAEFVSDNGGVILHYDRKIAVLENTNDFPVRIRITKLSGERGEIPYGLKLLNPGERIRVSSVYHSGAKWSFYYYVYDTNGALIGLGHF